MIKPLGDRLFLEPLRRMKSEGGIHLLGDSAIHSEGTQEYKVVAIGPGRRLKDGTRDSIWPEIQCGDMAITMALLSPPIEVDGHLLRVVRRNEILAVIPGAAASAVDLVPDEPLNAGQAYRSARGCY